MHFLKKTLPTNLVHTCSLELQDQRPKTLDIGGSGQKSFDHHAFYVGYNVTTVFYSTIQAAKGLWGLAPQKTFHNYILYNAGECPFVNIIRELQSIIFDIDKIISRYQVIKIQSYGRTRTGKIVGLEGGTAPLCHPLASRLFL